MSVKEQFIIALEREACKRSYYEFVKRSFHVLNPGTKFIDNWHIKYLCDHLQAKIESVMNGENPKDTVINVPPGSMKSTIFTICVAPWAWTRWKHFKHLGVSYVSEVASKHCRHSRKIITSDWYIKLFSDIELIKDENKKTSFENTQSGHRYSTGIGGSATSMHFHYISVDDPQNPKKARSETLRNVANKEYDETLQSRVINPNAYYFAIVMQRLHEDDLTGYVMRKNPNRYDHIVIPAEMKTEYIEPKELSENYVNSLYFPDRFPKKFIENQKIELGSFGYSGQYDQSPSPDDGGFLKPFWFGFYDKKNLDHDHITNYVCDTAFGKTSMSSADTDYSVTMASTTKDQKLYIKSIDRHRLPIYEFYDSLFEFLKNTGYNDSSCIYIEPKANGISIIDQLQNGIERNGQMVYLNVIRDKAPTDSKEQRMNVQVPKIEAGKVLLPIGDMPYSLVDEHGERKTVYVEPWVCDFLDECKRFPTGKHDDQVDTLEQSCRNFLSFNIWDIF